MPLKELSDGGPDGTRLGQTTVDKVSFYGATPAARYTVSTGLIASTASVSISATQWGFTSSAQATGLVTAVYNMSLALAALGLTVTT